MCLDVFFLFTAFDKLNVEKQFLLNMLPFFTTQPLWCTLVYLMLINKPKQRNPLADVFFMAIKNEYFLSIVKNVQGTGTVISVNKL